MKGDHMANWHEIYIIVNTLLYSAKDEEIIQVIHVKIIQIIQIYYNYDYKSSTHV